MSMSIGAIGGATRPDPSTMRNNMAQMDKTFASTLNMSVSDLRAGLQSGKTLGDLARAQGVSKDDLVKSIADTIGKNAPVGKTIPADTAQQIATNIVDGKGPGGAPGLDATQQVQGHQRNRHHSSASGSATSSWASGSTTGLTSSDTTAADLAQLLMQRRSAGI